MSARIEILDTPIAGLKVFQRKPIGDSRGYFERMFCSEDLKSVIPAKGIAQINHTMTAKRGTVRGLHFQYPPHAEIKLVNCLHGEIFDVAVDVRQGSPTFLHWYGELLSADNHRSLVVPEGFAHGFQALSEKCELLYFHTTAYQPGAEAGLSVHDPAIGIQWPTEVTELSPRDAAHAFVTKEFAGVSP